MRSYPISRQVASRRDFLKVKPVRTTIASMMVQAKPETMPVLIPALNRITGVEVHASGDNGRMVVTLETENDQHFMELVAAIESQEHVLNAQLVYHQIEEL